MSTSNGADLSPLQRAILFTALYSDLFDYPLTRDELRRYLTTPWPGPRTFDDALGELMPTYMSQDGDFLTLAGREATVAVRRERAPICRDRWPEAARYARWLRHVPFVRMVAVCGSQAAGNSRPDADVDFFLITEPGRLWTVQVCAMALRRVASIARVAVCPNYFLTLESLEVFPRDLYHAREVAQVVPLWGDEVYERFRGANRWVEQLLPNLAHADDRRDRLSEAPRSRLARGLEWLFRGKIGDGLDRAVHRLLLWYYPVRLRSKGLQEDQFRRAYRRDRQEVVAGGYRPVVEKAFRERARERLPDTGVDSEIERLFPPDSANETPDRVYSEQFVGSYGVTHD